MYYRAGVLAESELSAQDKSLPKLLSVIMVCVSVGLPVRLDPLEDLVTIAIKIVLRRRIIRCTVMLLCIRTAALRWYRVATPLLSTNAANSGALLSAVKLLTLLFNKCAARAPDDMEENGDDHDIQTNVRRQNPMYDEDDMT